MVKNKNLRGRSKHSSTRKTKTAVSWVSSSTELTPQDDPADSDGPAAPPEPRPSDQAPLGFPDGVYLLASVIFQNNHLEKPAAHRLVNYGSERGIPLPVSVKDEEMQHSAYELAFNTLKYQELLEDIMIDSCFYITQSIPDDQMALVAVMLCDFQERKFLPRERQGEGEEEELIQEVRDVENRLHRFKTKLAASLARCRIKHNLSSIECILPDSVKEKQERSSRLPLYAWVNSLKSSLEEVQGVLRSSGLSQVKSIEQLDGQTFCRDPHCDDVLVFPAQLRAHLLSTKLLRHSKLIIQDKSCSLGPNTVCSLLPEEGDVLMVGCFSGLTVAHTASLIAGKHKDDSKNLPTVYVCVGDRSHTQREDLQKTISAVGCKNVKLIPAIFHSLDGTDKQVEKVGVILLTPRCSMSAVSNPVEFLLRENGDTDLLQDLSQGSIASSRLEALVVQQRKDIAHALKFPRVSAVVYSTCSSYPEENEEVVSRALEQSRVHSEQEGEANLKADFRLSPTPFSSVNNTEDPKETDHCFKLEPSVQSNGCFLAILTREPEPVVKETPQEVLARANAKGLLDRIGSDQPTRKEHHTRAANRMTKTAHNPQNTQLQSSVRIKSKNQEARRNNSTSFCGHQQFSNKRQSSQGKPKAPCLQVRNSTMSNYLPSPKQENSCSSSSKPENCTPTKRITLAFSTTTNTATAAAATFHPAPLPAAPAVRPRRAHQEVLKPVVLALPPVNFPTFFPPQNHLTGFSPGLNCNKGRNTSQTVPFSHRSGGVPSRDSTLKLRPLF